MEAAGALPNRSDRMVVHLDDFLHGPPPRAWEVAISSGMAGAYVGCGCGWQSAVESAQVLAGVVQYPPDNPFYMYHVHVWTLLHQVPALLLACGLSEATISILLGGLTGMVSFLAVTLAALALSGKRWLAIVAPLFLLAGATFLETRGVYPLRLIADKPWIIYGAMGTSYVVLAWSLLALDRWRMAAFMLGVAPAVHPTLGSWGLGVALLASLCMRPVDIRWRPFLICLAAGISVTAISYTAQTYLARHIPDVPRDVQQQYLAAYAGAWDSHRQPYPLHDPSLLFAVCTLGLCGLVLWKFPDEAELDQSNETLECTVGRARMMAAMLFASTACALPLIVATHVPQWLPSVVQMAMPGRFINFTSLLFPVLVVGLLCFAPERQAQIALALVLGGCVLRLAHEASWVYFPEVWPVLGAGACLALASFGHLHARARNWSSRRLTIYLWVCGLAAAVIAWFAHGWSERLLIGGLAALCFVPVLGLDRINSAIVTMVVLAAIAGCMIIAAWHALGWVGMLGWCLVVLGAWCMAALWRESGCPPMRKTPGQSPHRGEHRRETEAVTWNIAVLVPPRLRIAVLAVSLAFMTGAILWQALSAANRLRDWRNDAFYAALHAGKGYVATIAGISSTQLRSRRPVLLEVSSLNQLPYVPQSGPAMNAILRDVYGEDLLRPPKGNLRRPGLDAQAPKSLWESRPLAAWQELARRHGFSNIIARSGWKVQLPIVAQRGNLTLYAIPKASLDTHPQAAPRAGETHLEAVRTPAGNQP